MGSLTLTPLESFHQVKVLLHSFLHAGVVQNAGKGYQFGASIDPFFPVWEAMGAALKKMLGIETCGVGMKESPKKLL